jgi:uncharacterized protein YkuJ
MTSKIAEDEIDFEVNGREIGIIKLVDDENTFTVEIYDRQKEGYVNKIYRIERAEQRHSSFHNYAF